eukprot:TRINITY_DN6591_c0_g1_i1.p1 TRINITY_DN6591_c0_g1~~TRINITY_DN6591_c0_g1_i1.p1  ORF type:complete len:320 (+),score=46.88 TRINITY_DN6591_c0_g1_i1:1-960(+)
MYDIQPLLTLCAQQLSTNLSIDNILTIIDSILLFFEDKQSISDALDLIRTEMDSLMIKKEFLSINFETLLAILQGPLKISNEILLFQTIKKWVEERGKIEDHLDKFHELVSFVDLSAVSVDEMRETLYPLRSLLPSDYLVDILFHLHNRSYQYTKPERSSLPGLQFSKTLKNPSITVNGPSAILKSLPGRYGSVLGDKALENNKVHTWRAKLTGPGNDWVAVGIIQKHSSISANYLNDYGSSYSCSSATDLFKTSGTIAKWQIGDVIEVCVDLQNNKITIQEVTRNTTSVTACIPPNQEWYPWFCMYQYTGDNSITLLE